MKVKRYVVDSMPSALQKIRVELGDQAVILNTKEIRKSGFLGIFGKRQIEVIAAVPAEQASQPKAVPEKPSLVPEKKSPVLSRVEPQPEVLKEIQGMKELLIGIASGSGGQEKVPKPLGKWMQRLKEQEVDQKVIDYLVEQTLRSFPSIEQAEPDAIRDNLLTQIEKIMKEGILLEPKIEKSVNMVSFVGPTGVGKTTTIAKMAAHQMLHHDRRVGMITTDTYRIAAVEQLKTYANILNVPIETVFSPDGLNKAMKNMQNCDLIFMDTTGRNYQDEQYVQQIGKYLAEQVVQENYLVLSLTSKYSDMKTIVDHFATFPIDKLILTKLDETLSYGAVLNLAFHYPYPLAYVTTGQNVPEDISKIESEKIARMMLGVADNHGSS
ncbi:flagellar biosynthesis protein FlhF [Ammoniphilus resinae]|uniref:Flagellar biosynthesis protein FlhF n=1 Tax=Ammoniphilus resinae TaxID=861532 RepID=A0ABS4GKL4_9BACL|nr:flagellar biosynthesis protein FlhF [Ammoniphilus resinae]